MLKTEKIILKKKFNPELFKWLREGTEIYNQTLYYYRQEYFQIRDGLKDGSLKTEDLKKHKWLKDMDVYNLVKVCESFKDSELDHPVKTSAFKLACQNIKAFKMAKSSWKKNPSKFKGMPQLPRYKKNGMLIGLAVDKTRLCGKKKFWKQHEVILPKSKIHVHLPDYIEISSIHCLEIQPYYGRIKINVAYDEKEDRKLSLDKNNVIGIDIGLSNLCSITANNQRKSWIVKGGQAKSMNQFYNKKMAELKSKLEKINSMKTSKRIDRLCMKRKEKIWNLFHNVSRKIVNLCIENDIGRIAIGHNKEWKQNANMGKKTNQKFVQIPFNVLIQMIDYKAKEVGIEVVITEESYTSKTDHLVLEDMKHQETYLGKRIKRGLFKSSCGKILNADINGAIGIMRKLNVFSDVDLINLRNRGDVVSPMNLSVKG